MKTWNIPGRIDAFIFDVDSTLYTHDAFARSQIDGQIARLANLRGQSPEATKAEIEAWRGDWSRRNGGRKISLGNTFREFGVTIEESIAWRTELIRPERYLSTDTRLRETLSALAKGRKLGVVTNNPVAVARSILASLGVSGCFSSIVGLDTLALSKPHREIFLRSARDLDAAPAHCVAVGDRYDIDIALPLELGMGGVLVDGVEDVYRLVDL